MKAIFSLSTDIARQACRVILVLTSAEVLCNILKAVDVKPRAEKRQKWVKPGVTVCDGF